MEIEYGFYDDKLYVIIHGSHINPWNWDVVEMDDESITLSTTEIIPRDVLELKINQLKASMLRPSQ